MRHRFHALCPYFAMFPESFAETWIRRLTRRDDLVLDPFCGRGTTLFQALLMGREAAGVDINPVAYCVSRAKTNAPAASSLRGRITVLERGFDRTRWSRRARSAPQFFHHAYHRRTLPELLYLRESLRWRRSDVDCMLAALMLGILHGESVKSSNVLSNQMPRTISTKPAYSVRFWEKHGLVAPERRTFDLLRHAIGYRYESEPPEGRASIFLGDMRELPRWQHSRRPSCVITSPPYLNVTRYEEDQWLRLWFLGGAPHPTYGRISQDDRHENVTQYWRLLADMWRVLGDVVAPNAKIVIRIGAVRQSPSVLLDGLLGTAVLSGRRVRLVERSVSGIKGRQTDVFRPGSSGCRTEVDGYFRMR